LNYKWAFQTLIDSSLAVDVKVIDGSGMQSPGHPIGCDWIRGVITSKVLKFLNDIDGKRWGKPALGETGRPCYDLEKLGACPLSGTGRGVTLTAGFFRVVLG
jgi:hypothetical protein